MHRGICPKCGCYVPATCACRYRRENEPSRYGIKRTPEWPEWFKQMLEREYTR